MSEVREFSNHWKKKKNKEKKKREKKTTTEKPLNGLSKMAGDKKNV